MSHETTKHLFHNSTESLFRAKLNKFHDHCATHLVMCGVGDIDCDIQTVKMAPLRHDVDYCKRLMGGMLQHKPGIHILLHDEHQHKEFELMVTKLHDPHKHLDIDMSGVYLYQAAHDYPHAGKCLYQFWTLNKNNSMSAINNLWNES